MIPSFTRANFVARQSNAGDVTMLLLDTDVMIDVLRGHDVALEWLHSLADETIGLPGFVAMELL